MAQMAFRQVPNYTVIQESGPDHDKRFKIQLTVRNLKAEGNGKSKKQAEQDAARKALVLLSKEQMISDGGADKG